MLDNIDIIKILVPLVRNILEKGLSQNFMKGCVRIGDVFQITGGLKSNFIGRVRIDINSIIKIHTEELKQHQLLIKKVNKSAAPIKVFPDVLQVTKLDDDKYIMLMEELLKHESFLQYIYSKPLTKKQLQNITSKALERITLVHNTMVNKTDNFPINNNPYFGRIKEKIKEVLKIDNDLRVMMNNKGSINGNSVNPITQLLTKIEGWLNHDLTSNNLCLVHGDCHLENILFRPRGNGFSCVTIDPNPLIGISDSLYDYGKLMHWVDIVGWAKFQHEKCKSRWTYNGTSWEMSYWLDHELQSVIRRRNYVTTFIADHLKKNSSKLNGDWKQRLNISLASAHLGLAAILNNPEEKELRRFVFGRGLQLLYEIK